VVNRRYVSVYRVKEAIDERAGKILEAASTLEAAGFDGGSWLAMINTASMSLTEEAAVFVARAAWEEETALPGPEPEPEMAAEIPL
jgi:hypothetical protein